MAILDRKFRWYKLELKNKQNTLEEFIYRGLTINEQRIASQYMEKEENYKCDTFILSSCVLNLLSPGELILGTARKLIQHIWHISGFDEAARPWREALWWLESEHGCLEAAAVCMISGLDLEKLENCDPSHRAKYLAVGKFLFESLYKVRVEDAFNFEAEQESQIVDGAGNPLQVAPPTIPGSQSTDSWRVSKKTEGDYSWTRPAGQKAILPDVISQELVAKRKIKGAALVDKGFHKPHSFLRKTEGVLVLGGIIGLGLTKGRPAISKLIESVVESSAGQRVIDSAAAKFRPNSASFASFIDEYVSDSSQTFNAAAKKIRSVMASALVGQERSEIFLSNLKPFANRPDLFENKEFIDNMGKHLSKVAAAREVGDIDSGFLSREGIEEFNSALGKHGVKLNFKSSNEQLATFKGILRDISVKSSDPEINSRLATEKYQEQIFSFLHAARQDFKDKETRVSAMLTPDAKHITWQQLDDKGGYGQAANKFYSVEAHQAVLKTITGQLHVRDEVANKWLQTYISDSRKHLKLAFGDVDNKFLDNALAEFEQSNTGFVLNARKKQAISLQQIKRTKDQVVQAALDHLQIPLVPYQFNAHVKSLQVLPKARDLIKDLGQANNQPEILRMMNKGIISSEALHQNARLISVGDRILGLGSDSVHMLPGRYASLRTRDGSMAKRLAHIRSLTPGSYFKNVAGMRQSKTAQNKLRDILHSFSGLYARVGVVNNPDGASGLVMLPSHPAFSPLVKMLYGTNGFVDPRTIHPALLMEALNKPLSSADRERTLEIAIQEASRFRVDSSGFFKDVSAAISTDGKVKGLKYDHIYGKNKTARRGSISDVLLGIMHSSDNPAEIVDLLNKELERHNDLNILNMESYLERNLPHPLVKALTALKVSQKSLGLNAQQEGGILTTIDAKIRGNSGMSEIMMRLQEGLYSHLVGGLGVGKYGGFESLGHDVVTMYDRMTSGALYEDLAKGNKSSARFVRDLSKLGITNTDKLRDMLLSLVVNSRDGLETNNAKLGEISSLLLDKNSVLGLSDDNKIQAKLIEALRKNINNSNIINIETRNHYLQEYVNDGNIQKTIKERFHLLRPFHPEMLGAAPLADTRFYVVQDNAPKIGELFKDPQAVINSINHSSGNVGSFIKSVLDPNAQHGKLSMWAHALSLMPEHLAEGVGLGLPLQDQLSPLRAGLGWWLKRVVPLYVGVELYKNLNANMHEAHLPGVDDIGANVIANTNLIGASIKDTFGITTAEQHLVHALPGLDQFFHPRSRKEYEEYLDHGEEEVRSGRGYLIGSRGALMGGRIKGVRPNFFRRWHSHWTEAENVDISNPEHSWLPSPLHPFSPIARMLHPDWFIDKHLKSRPYRASAGGHSQPMEEGDYLYSNSVGAYGGFASIGTLGRGLPTQLSGGGEPEMFNPYGPGIGNGKFGINPGPASMHGGFTPHGSLGDKLEIGLNKDIPLWATQHGGLKDKIGDWTENVRHQSGLFGEVMQLLPGLPHPSDKVKHQNYKAAISSNRLIFGGSYGEFTGGIGELTRRLIHPDVLSKYDDNDLPNNSGSWMPNEFKRGDPLTKTPYGEMNMPGDAYLRLNSWAKPLKVRGSNIGLSEQELIEKWLYPTEPLSGGQEGEDIVEWGSAVHKMLQRKLNKEGKLIGAEVSIFDDKNNLSGTIDAIVRGPNGNPEILDFKTQGGKSWGQSPEKYKEQITAYMAMTGIHMSHLVYINRDNPEETRVEDVPFSEERWEHTLNKVNNARAIMNKMTEKGEISPFESYDLLSRIDILSKVAPESKEFRDLIAYADKGVGFGGFEKQVYDRAKERAARLSEDYNLYPKIYGIKKETHRLKVDAVTENGEILTNKGTIRLAGVKFDQQAFAYDEPAEVLAKYGIKVGHHINVTLMQGQFDEDLLNDLTLPAIVGRANKKLMNSEYAHPMEDSKNPMDSQAVRGESTGGRLYEWLAHSDNMISNKFLRTRTALDQLAHGEVYGTDDTSWEHLWDSFGGPTLSAITSKNPFLGALKGAAIASLFFSGKVGKTKAAKIGGAIGGALAALRVGYEFIMRRKWRPKRVKKQEDFDEYWDTLTYVKWATMAEAAKKKAKKFENVDLDLLEENDKRETVGLGQYGTLAVYAERRAKQTMYGFDIATGNFEDAVLSLPKRHRQLAESIVQTGSVAEKRRFYDLLGRDEQRVLGKFLGVDELSVPRKPQLTDYFKHHYLPKVDWAGWQSQISDDDLRTVAEDEEGTKVERPNRERVARSRAYTLNTPIPKMYAKTPSRIRATLNQLMARSNFAGVHAKYVIRPAEKNTVFVQSSIFQEQTQDLINQTNG